jgi:hypothetical protein
MGIDPAQFRRNVELARNGSGGTATATAPAPVAPRPSPAKPAHTHEPPAPAALVAEAAPTIAPAAGRRCTRHGDHDDPRGCPRCRADYQRRKGERPGGPGLGRRGRPPATSAAAEPGWKAELTAMDTCYAALDPLGPEARDRVLRWVNSRLEAAAQGEGG